MFEFILTIRERGTNEPVRKKGKAATEAEHANYCFGRCLTLDDEKKMLIKKKK